MALAVGKTPPKPPNEMKKEGTPVKQDEGKKETQDNGKNNSQNENKNDRNQNRDSNRQNDSRGNNNERFQNRRGGRGGGPNHRGGFNKGGRDFRGDGGPGQYQKHDSNFQSSMPQGDFTGEQNDGPKEQKKFTGRCRLFVGNITPNTTEEQFKEMFTPFGEVSEVFVNAAKGFGFIRLDYRINAEKAKMELDGQMRNNRILRVRFATHGAALKVTNLSPFVSNELLEQAFNQFGEVERAIVTVDDRGRSCGEGIIEFARKPGATSALKRINEGVFLLSSYPRPMRVEPLEQKDEEDGLTEKFVQRNEGFRKDREKEPRFAPPGSFEFEFGMKYRRIDEMEKEQFERVKKECELERTRLVEEMETAVFDYQADQIRQDLVRQQEELKRLDEMKNEHMRRRQELDMRRQESMRGDQMRGEQMRGDQMRGNESMMRQQQEDERRAMMMRASNTMNREREMSRDGGNMGGSGGPDRNRGRPDEMMRGPPPQGRRDSPQRGNSSGGNQRGSGPGTPPMPPPPVPPGMNMEQNRPGPMEGERFGPGMPGGMPSRSPSSERPMDRPMDRPPPGMGNMNKDMPPQRPGPPGPPGGRFPGGPPGPGNFPPQGMGNMGGGPPRGGPMFHGPGPNNPGMGPGNDRPRDGRREDFENAKRMRRY